MHHKRIQLARVQSILSGLKPGETAGPAGRRLHRRFDLKNNQMLQNSGKCCHSKGTEQASSEDSVRSASSSWNDEKCGGWTLGSMSATSGGGEIGVGLSQSEESHAHRICYKTFPGDIFYLTRYETTRLGSVPRDDLFQHGWEICASQNSKSKGLSRFLKHIALNSKRHGYKNAVNGGDLSLEAPSAWKGGARFVFLSFKQTYIITSADYFIPKLQNVVLSTGPGTNADRC